MSDVIVRRTAAERIAYGQGFEAGARLILKHWHGGNLTADKSEELLASLLTLFPTEANR